MDLKKCTLNYNGYEENIQCPLGTIKDVKKYKLLGFTNSLPVLVDDNESIEKQHKQAVSLNNKTLNVKIGVDAGTGEKFLFTTSGQKLKVVQQTGNIQEFLKTNSLTLSDNPKAINNKLLHNRKTPSLSSQNELIKPKPQIRTPIVSSLNDLVIKTKSEKSQHVDKGFIFNTNNVDKIIRLSQVLSKKHNTSGDIENFTIVKIGAGPGESGTIKTFPKVVKKNTSNVTVFKTKENSIRRCYRGAHKMQALDLRKPSQSPIDIRMGMVSRAMQTENKLVDVGVQADLFEWDLDLFDCDELLKEIDVKPAVHPHASSNGLSVMNSSIQQANPNAMKFYTELRSAIQPDDQGNMPIHVGVLTNNMKLVKRSCFMLKALKLSVDIVNNLEHTPLQLAIMHDASLEIIQYLLSNGANLNTMDSEGNYILHLATEHQRKAALRILLQHAIENCYNFNMCNNKGLTALMIACMNSYYDCADLLLEYGADTNIRDQISGRTALFHAAEKHDERMVQLLLDFHANTKEKNFFGISPHDAMYEIEDMPENIKALIFGKHPKRKANDMPNHARTKQRVPYGKYDMKGLKTYARYEKISEVMITKME